jgi:hypothetical protein
MISSTPVILARQRLVGILDKYFFLDNVTRDTTDFNDTMVVFDKQT